MASVLDIIKHYQQSIEKYSDDEGKVLRCIDKLFQLRVTVQHLQETGVGRTVNALRKEPGEVGQAARALVLKWKTMVAAEESDQEGDPRNDTSSHNGHGSGKESDDHMQQSRNTHDKDNSSNVSTPKLEQREKPTENGHHSGSKRKYHSSEEEDQDAKKKSRHTSSSDDDKKKVVVKQEKLSNSESSGDDSESSDSDSDSYSSESSQEELKVKQEIKKERKESPERHKSSSSKHSHSNHDDHKRDSSSSKKHESDKRESDKHSHHKSSSKDMSRQSSESSSKSSSHKHKNSHEKENNSDKRHKSDTSSDEKKESKSSSKHSSEKHKSSSHKHENSSERQKSSDKHSSKEHKSSPHTDKAPEKHKSSSDKDSSKHKSKESSSSSKERHSSSSKEKSKERSSSSSKERSSQSNSSEKKHSSGDSKSQNSDKSKHKSEDGSSEKKSKDKSSSSSSHKSKSSSSSSKSKEDVPKKMSKLSNSEESGEDGIDCGSGASFAEALGMAISPTKPKKKSSTRDINSPNNSFINDLSPAALLAPSAKLAPLPMLEISALPEISPNYKPRPPPKLLPHFTDEDAISAGISSKNQRTKVYSGNKVIGKITSLYEMCVQVLQEHIDALEYTGGVPYEILKPVVDRATPQQLFLLEHYNPYLMEDTDHLWQRFCEKNFRNKRRQELESWREMYMRCQEEQEYKLKSLTANIRLTQEAKKAPIKQTKMAYVDSVVKPPRNIARKQAQHGTAHAATASPASRVASLSATPGVLKGGSPRPPPAPSVSASSFNKPKKAPLMQKALQFMRGRKR